MTNRIRQVQDTAITWASAGGDETLTLNSLANGSARQGDEHDFGSTSANRVRIMFESACSSSPTVNNVINLYWASSHDGTDYDGEATGADAAYTNTAAGLARMHYVGSLVLSANTAQQRSSWLFLLPARYGAPAVHNRSGQILPNSASLHTVVVTPLVDEVQ